MPGTDLYIPEIEKRVFDVIIEFKIKTEFNLWANNAMNNLCFVCANCKLCRCTTLNHNFVLTAEACELVSCNHIGWCCFKAFQLLFQAVLLLVNSDSPSLLIFVAENQFSLHNVTLIEKIIDILRCKTLRYCVEYDISWLRKKLVVELTCIWYGPKKCYGKPSCKCWWWEVSVKVKPEEIWIMPIWATFSCGG